MWKTLSVVLAFVFWWAVVTYEDPIREETFENVPVYPINEESVTDNNYAIEYLEGKTVDVKVTAKRSIIDKMTLGDIYAYADISNLSLTNAIDIEVDVKGEYQSYDVYPANMKVNIESIITESKEIQYIFEGETADDYITLSPIITPSVIQITGPESQVNQISSVLVSIPLNDATRDVTLFYTPDILDANNNPIAKVEANVDTVGITVPVLLTKTVPIRFEAIDTVPQGFEFMSGVLDKETVFVRGSEDDLEDLEEIVIDDVLLISKTFDQTLDLYIEDYLPSDVDVIGYDTHVNLTIDVEAIEVKSITVTNGDIDVKNLPDGMIFAYVGEESLEVVVQGIASRLSYTNVDRLEPYIQLTGLEPGEHEVVVRMTTANGVEIISEEQVVTVTLTEAPSDEEEPVEEGEEVGDDDTTPTPDNN